MADDTKMRAAFEKWAIEERGWNIKRETYGYRESEVDAAWYAWQAADRAAREEK